MKTSQSWKGYSASMTPCFCTGECQRTGRCPNAGPWPDPDKATGPLNDYESKRKAKAGWICPVCGRGNAPFALRCGHCR